MAIDVIKEIDKSPVGKFHILLIILCGLVTVIDGFDLVAMGVVAPSIAEDWGLEVSAFGPAMSAALFGVLFGSGAAGPLADNIGRKYTMIIMLLITAIFMLLTTTVSGMTELVVYRFFTGFGAGGSIPIAIALTSEYMPSRYRNVLIVIMYSGAPIGSVLASTTAPYLIEQGSWQSVFILGGVLPLIVSILLYLYLAESLKYLVNKGCDIEVVKTYLVRLNPIKDYSEQNEFQLNEVTHRGSPIRELFGGAETSKTLIIWLIYFANQFIIFLLALWMPSLFTESGYTLEVALYALAIYNIGGVLGGALFGWLSDRLEALQVLKFSYPISALLVSLIGFISESNYILYGLVFITGIGVIGSSLMLGAMTASLYPTRARSTGLGWALAIGRGGSIISPIIVGVALAAGWKAQTIFIWAGVAPIVCGAGILLLINNRSVKEILTG